MHRLDSYCLYHDWNGRQKKQQSQDRTKRNTIVLLQYLFIQLPPFGCDLLRNKNPQRLLQPINCNTNKRIQSASIILLAPQRLLSGQVKIVIVVIRVRGKDIVGPLVGSASDSIWSWLAMRRCRCWTNIVVVNDWPIAHVHPPSFVEKVQMNQRREARVGSHTGVENVLSRLAAFALVKKVGVALRRRWSGGGRVISRTVAAFAFPVVGIVRRSSRWHRDDVGGVSQGRSRRVRMCRLSILYRRMGRLGLFALMDVNRLLLGISKRRIKAVCSMVLLANRDFW